MKSKNIKRSTFCLCMLGLNICVWLVLYFFLFNDVVVRGCYQGKLTEVLDMVAQSETGIRQSIVTVKYYQNDVAAPQKDDMVTAIEFVGDDDVLFYKGEIHEQTLIDERVRLNRKMTNIFMGIFCAIFAMLYLIYRKEEKQAQKVWLDNAHGN